MKIRAWAYKFFSERASTNVIISRKGEWSRARDKKKRISLKGKNCKRKLQGKKLCPKRNELHHITITNMLLFSTFFFCSLVILLSFSSVFWHRCMLLCTMIHSILEMCPYITYNIQISSQPQKSLFSEERFSFFQFHLTSQLTLDKGSSLLKGPCPFKKSWRLA